MDITGGWLLGRGLLASPVELAQRAGAFLGANPHASLGAARDKVDAYFGLGALMLGFALQGVGYAVTIGSGGGNEVGWERALVALAMAIAGGAAVMFVWRIARERLVRHVLIGAAHYDTNTGEMADKPFAPTLNVYARLLGYEIREGEDGPAFAERVFGVADVYPTGQRT